METYQTYKGYGIEYSTMTGTTVVTKNGFVVEVFERQGELEG